jgi:hypothetical protein
MTKEEILKIAKEYDLIAGNAEHGISTLGIVNFAILIANYEREACAKRLDAVGCDHCATNIRLRGQE